MSFDSIVQLNSRAGQETDVQCGHCAGKTKHLVLSDVKNSGSEGPVDWMTDYQIIQCQGCRSISFRSVSSNSEDYTYDYDEEGKEVYIPDVEERLYPPRIAGYKGLGADVWRLPEKLSRIYRETAESLALNQPVLTGIGIRAILETLCKDQNALGKDLFSKIDSLVENKILTPRRASILHKIRALGNKSAHEVAPHNPAQLALAMTVVDHLLQEVYIFPALETAHFSDLEKKVKNDEFI